MTVLLWTDDNIELDKQYLIDFLNILKFQLKYEEKIYWMNLEMSM